MIRTVMAQLTRRAAERSRPRVSDSAVRRAWRWRSTSAAARSRSGSSRSRERSRRSSSGRWRPSGCPGAARHRTPPAGGSAVRDLAKFLDRRRPPSRWWPSPAPGSGRAPSPSDEAGEPVGPCVMWLDTRGAEHSRERRRRAGAAATRQPRCATWIRRTAGVPSPHGGDPVSHMLHLERDAAAGRGSRSLVPRAGRLPDHAVHRAGGGDPRLDERRLADRQPAPRPARLRLGARRAGPASTRPSCRRCVATGVGRRRRCAPRSRRELGLGPGGAGRHRHARPALRGARHRRGRARARPT